jgi:AP endonuclease-1
MRDPLMAGIPLVLETPANEKALEAGELSLWTKEIKMLYEIQGINDDEWPAKRIEIEARWRIERDKLNPPKIKEKGPKGKKGKGKKAKGDVEEDDSDDGDD